MASTPIEGWTSKFVDSPLTNTEWHMAKLILIGRSDPSAKQVQLLLGYVWDFMDYWG